jgi:hypothetical protein
VEVLLYGCAVKAAAVPQQLHVLGGGGVEKKQVYFEYAKVRWESDQVGLVTSVVLVGCWYVVCQF